jgi:hypothetical protein
MQQNVDWDALLRSPATETVQHDHLSDIQLGQLAEGIENLEAELPPGVVEGSSLAPGLRDVRLAEVIGPVIQGQETSTLNVAQCLDLWSRGLNASGPNHAGVVPQQCYPPPMAAHAGQHVIQGSVLNIQLAPLHDRIDEEKELAAMNRAERQRKRKEKQEESVRRKMSAHASGSDMVPIPTGLSSSQITVGAENQSKEGIKTNGPRRRRSVKSDERAVCCLCTGLIISGVHVHSFIH